MFTRRALFKAVLALPAVAVMLRGRRSKTLYVTASSTHSHRIVRDGLIELPLDEIVTTTLRKHRHLLADNVSSNNALFKRLREKDTIS